ncbi:MAG: hypothetical protein R6U58_01970, partial [Bacteroidales bacterium]
LASGVGWRRAPYLHTVIPSQKLDERQGNGRASTSSAQGIKSKSPHDMLQAFLNATKPHAVLWQAHRPYCGKPT